ncbi:hypothetical protein E2C01_006684 [Portunus trituberculatus]|uniref:Uncharacterized protein n=1 Tax=Portunus trituberculatus TaxID=210409 RepID=A0A5B7D0C0_PORTR|nr:hypothetical protein [Portunus trituberculatus]
MKGTYAGSSNRRGVTVAVMSGGVGGVVVLRGQAQEGPFITSSETRRGGCNSQHFSRIKLTPGDLTQSHYNTPSDMLIEMLDK